MAAKPSDESQSSAEAIRLNVSETYLALGAGAPGAVVVRSERAWTCRSAFDHPIGNFAVYLSLSDDDVRYLADSANGTPDYRIYYMTGDRPADLPRRLEELGLIERYALTGLELEEQPRDSSELLQRCRDDVQVQETAQFMVDTFFWRSAGSLRATLALILADAGKRGHEFYFAKDKRGYLAAASLSITGNVAGLYNLCVRPRERGRGLGSEAVHQLSRISLARGDRLVCQCDRGLVQWYERLGFAQASELRAYSS